jgi:hypothetical protein
LPSGLLYQSSAAEESHELGGRRLVPDIQPAEVADLLTENVVRYDSAEPKLVTRERRLAVRADIEQILADMTTSGAKHLGLPITDTDSRAVAQIGMSELFQRPLFNRLKDQLSPTLTQACKIYVDHPEYQDILRWALQAYACCLVDLDTFAPEVTAGVRQKKSMPIPAVYQKLQERLDAALAEFLHTLTHEESLQLVRARTAISQVVTDIGYFRILRQFLTRRQFAQLELPELSRGECHEVGGKKTILAKDQNALASVISSSFGPSRVAPFLRELQSGKLRMHYHELQDIGAVCCAGEFIIDEQWGCLDWLGQKTQSGGTVKALRILNARTSPRRLFSTCNWRSLPVQAELLDAIGSDIDDESYSLPYIRTLVLSATEKKNCPAKQPEHANEVQALVDQAKRTPGVLVQLSIAGVMHQAKYIQLAGNEISLDQQARQTGGSFYMGKALFETVQEVRQAGEMNSQVIVRCIPEGDCNFPGPTEVTVIFGPNPVDTDTWQQYGSARREYKQQTHTIHAAA